MSASIRIRAALFVVSVALAVACAGCGSHPPCQTDITAVDAARSAAKANEAQLEDARRSQSDLQLQVEAEVARQQELKQRKAELQAKLAELGK